MPKTALAKTLTVKIAAAAIGVAAAGGGVALAASAGGAPTAGLGPSAAASHAPAPPTGKASTTGSDRENGNAAPSPSIVGLCRAFAAGAGDNPGKALDNPAFGALVAAAGDKAKVADYCAPMLERDAPGSPATAAAGQPAAGRPTPKATPSHPAPDTTAGSRPSPPTPDTP
jgi:hypothetical protein